MNNIRCEEVIISDLHCRGEGTPTSVFRRVLQVYRKDGELIAEKDPCAPTHDKSDMIIFARFCRNYPELMVEDIYKKWIDGMTTRIR